jgi:hypothetical protein
VATHRFRLRTVVRIAAIPAGLAQLHLRKNHADYAAASGNAAKQLRVFRKQLQALKRYRGKASRRSPWSTSTRTPAGKRSWGTWKRAGEV